VYFVDKKDFKNTRAGLYLVHEIGPTRATLGPYLFPLGGVILGVVFLREI
jgi:drug/metabolite transporter (DMT)-like permease